MNATASICALVAALLLPGISHAQDLETPAAQRLERVKTTLHFGISVGMAYYAEDYFYRRHPEVPSFWAAAGTSFAVGALKEVVDHTFRPGARGSGKDLMVDAAGALTGAWLSQALRADNRTAPDLRLSASPAGGFVLTYRQRL